MKSKLLIAMERIATALEGNHQGRPVMTIEEAAQYLGVSVNTVYTLVECYGLRVYRLTGNGCVRFRKVDLDAWVATRAVETPSDHKRIMARRPGRTRVRPRMPIDHPPLSKEKEESSEPEIGDFNGL